MSLSLSIMSDRPSQSAIYTEKGNIIKCPDLTKTFWTLLLDMIISIIIIINTHPIIQHPFLLRQ